MNYFFVYLAIVRVRVYYIDFFVFLFYVTGEFHRFLRGRAVDIAVLTKVVLQKREC